MAGPLIGLMVPALLLAGNRSFGISSTWIRSQEMFRFRGLPHVRHHRFRGPRSAVRGPLFALVGGGVSVMLVVLLGAIGGTWVYGTMRATLPH